MKHGSAHTPYLSIEADVPLAPLTTIGLGGEARHFAYCANLETIRSALVFARERNLPVHVLGGGSNVIFEDGGFPGLVLQVALRGISVYDGTPCTVIGFAGEPWDDFVSFCVDFGLQGLECLSGIPGSVGATPIQNVGAYGQEVSETILSVTALDRESLEIVEFPGVKCWFGYRKSRFKAEDVGRYIIISVTFGLHRNAPPAVRYPELQRAMESAGPLEALGIGRPRLLAVRTAVLGLRKKKSMVTDPTDPHSKSVGSFFVNPLLKSAEFQNLQRRWASSGNGDPVPAFPASDGQKVPAAWLVEHAGFPRGYRQGGVGVSANHALALVNYGGTTRELLDLAAAIRRAVEEKFAIRLEQEPLTVSSTAPSMLMPK